ncbi:MAG: RpiB/LacA/LacB family sugar-phosphate isomerase [Candidatus Jorgensenbacteria bacterium]
MIIYIGADHRGFELKERIKGFLKDKGYQVADLGNDRYDENDDYPDFAEAVAKKVSLNYESARGILVCSSGVGVDVIANKFQNVRSALVASSDQAFDSRNDDDSNVLSLAATYLKPEDAEKIVLTWIGTPFADEEKFKRRLGKIRNLELKVSRPIDEEEK